MPRFILSPTAEKDLAGIWSFIAEENPAAADRLIEQPYGTFRMLSENPHAGRLREEARKRFRSLACGKYIVFYRPTENGIEVGRVLHGARDLPRGSSDGLTATADMRRSSPASVPPDQCGAAVSS